MRALFCIEITKKKGKRKVIRSLICPKQWLRLDSGKYSQIILDSHICTLSGLSELPWQ
jgi:hypothetical protein